MKKVTVQISAAPKKKEKPKKAVGQRVKKGDFIKLTEAFMPGERKVGIPLYDVVQVTDVGGTGEGLEVRTVMNDIVRLPPGFPFKKVKSANLEALFEFSASSSDVLAELTGAQYSQGSGIKLENNRSIIFNRCINRMQTIASNALVAEDPVAVSKLSVAACAVTMACNEGMLTNQSSKLLTLAAKLVGSTN